MPFNGGSIVAAIAQGRDYPGPRLPRGLSWGRGRRFCSAAPEGERVTLRDVVGIEDIELCVSLTRELIFAHNAFVAVQLALHTVLENTGLFGQQADDLKAAPGRVLLVPVG